MNLKDIALLRLSAQEIAHTKLKKTDELVTYMGAIQAQDYAMSKWAIGSRLPNSTDRSIEAALNTGKILRTHVMRPTWHLVSAENIHWLLELTAPHVLPSSKARYKELGLSEDIIKKTNSIIEKSLAEGKHLTREELVERFDKAKIKTDNMSIIHILFRAELDGIICSGIANDKKQTYALLDERVPTHKIIKREEALAKLANIYFTSHGPATLQDFVWWSGLKISDAKLAIETIKSSFISIVVENDTYWFSDSIKLPKRSEPSVYLLPAFDEYLISYKNRTASIALKDQQKAFTANGIFRPVIVVNGEVTGIWKRTIKKDTVTIEADFFKPHTKEIKLLIEKQANCFGDFLEKKVEIKYR